MSSTSSNTEPDGRDVTIDEFCQACRKGDIEKIRHVLLSQPELVDADDQHKWRPIFHAALRKHETIVQMLIEAGADVSAHDGYVLHYAAEVPENHAVVRLLVENGVIEAHTRPADDLSRQLLYAIYLSNTVRIEKLLERHAQLATTADGRGDVPIHHAARNGETAIVRLLAAAGADVNSRNTRQHTVLYCAGGHGHVESVKALLELGADADATFTDDGKNLAQWLAQYPDEPHLQEVLDELNRMTQ